MKTRDYSKNRKGSNQYRNKERGDWKKIFCLFMWVVFLSMAGATYFRHEGVKAMADEYTKVAGQSAMIVPVVKEKEEKVQSKEEMQKEIEAYIKTIFGKDWKTAVAVSRNECGVTYKSYPRCRYTTAKEDSIGIFQINIQSQTTKVHWSRIPGDTLDEKVEWLKDPHNNTLMAYWIYSNSGWTPWSAYTSGNYLKDM